MAKRNVTINSVVYNFNSLKELMAKASPLRSGDILAGVAAQNEQERVAAQICLSEVPLRDFLGEDFVPAEEDEVSRLILKQHDAKAFELIKDLTVGEFRNWLLDYNCTNEVLESITWALTPEILSAVSKIMCNQDLILVASKRKVITKFRDTLGLKGHFSSRLQPNHPSDDLMGITASTLDGLLYGSGDAVIGINPATDSVPVMGEILKRIDDLIQRYEIPTQSCVLAHLTNSIEIMKQNVPIDLVFQSIAGTQKANENFGINLDMIDEAHKMALSLNRGTVGNNVMYFETGQGSALSAEANFGMDMQTCEARAYAVAREFPPLLINTVVGFIGPEYLYNGKQITRAGLEDHFCGKLLGLPMGCDVCYTNHADADQNDMDNLLTLLASAGLNFAMGIPGCDDIMLGYQTTSFHDILYIRQLYNLRAAPEFEDWLLKMNIFKDSTRLNSIDNKNLLLKDEFIKA
ncbi:MAG: ethanolamine ammonia-lyase subunit EutB [Opitutales bacterium]